MRARSGCSLNLSPLPNAAVLFSSNGDLRNHWTLMTKKRPDSSVSFRLRNKRPLETKESFLDL